MKKTIRMLFILFLGFWGNQMHAQTSFNAASNSATIDEQIFEYTVGDMTLIHTESNANLIITQGFLQPNSLNQSPSSISETTANTSNLQVFPNPTENELFIESTETTTGTIELNLYDALGKTLISKKENQTIGNNKHNISLKSFAPGSYFLIITKPIDSNKTEKLSYKIQKIN